MVGKKLKNETEKIKEVRVVDDQKTKVFYLPIRLFVLLIILKAANHYGKTEFRSEDEIKKYFNEREVI